MSKPFGRPASRSVALATLALVSSGFPAYAGHYSLQTTCTENGVSAPYSSSIFVAYPLGSETMVLKTVATWVPTPGITDPAPKDQTNPRNNVRGC